MNPTPSRPSRSTFLPAPLARFVAAAMALWLGLASTAPAAPDRVMTVVAGVDGMVCAFCAQGLLAHFRRHPAVSRVHVDLGRSILVLEEKQGASITDEQVKEAIERSGFEPGGVQRRTDSFDEVKDEK